MHPYILGQLVHYLFYTPFEIIFAILNLKNYKQKE